MKNLSKNQTGQGLLEMLVALFILVVALTATIVLIVTSINAGREGKNKLIATNLAREGIEIVRNIRDGNWIDPSDVDWDDGLDTVVIGSVQVTPRIINTATPTPITLEASTGFSDDKAQIKLDGNNYLQGTGATGNGISFFRVLFINPICQKNDGSGDEIIASNRENTDTCDNGVYSGYQNKVGIRVISEVRWPSSSSGREVTIEDRLYNWQVL